MDVGRDLLAQEERAYVNRGVVCGTQFVIFNMQSMWVQSVGTVAMCWSSFC